MTYSEALFFIGKCLTLGNYPERTDEIRNQIRSGVVEWEQVVWVSTGQFVFPALHQQLKRAGLLPELPTDLVEYMEEFSDANRVRNQQIIDQAKEIAGVLNQLGISPIFLKGTAHLLDGVYEDIGERMLADIDFLVDEKRIPEAYAALQNDGYFIPEDIHFEIAPMHRHYPVLVKDGKCASIEMHRWAVKNPYQKRFTFEMIDQDKKKLPLVEGAFTLSDSHKIIHNMMVVQMNDFGFWRGTIYLRQIYDLFLLADGRNPLEIVKNFGHYFQRLNAYLAISNKLLGKPAGLPYEPTWLAKLYVNRIRIDVTYPKFARVYKFVLGLFNQLYSYISQIIMAIFRKDVRQKLSRSLRNPKWYGQHFRSLKERL